MLGDVSHKNVLLLQGPVGPFFRQLGVALESAGARVTKVNFNGGDEAFFRGPNAIAFQGTRDQWPAYFRELVQREAVDLVILFGDCREMHRQAIAEANDLGVRVYVFEEGYVRPDYITFERGGVNARSTLPRTLAPFLERAEQFSDDAVPMGNTFVGLAWCSALYSWAATLLWYRFPHYQHHKDLNVFRQTYVWGRGGVRKLWYRLVERGQLEELCNHHKNQYFLAPLQVHFDAQVTHSEYGSNEVFIEKVMRSFVEHAPDDTLLVFKHHPLDRPFRDYGKHIRALSGKLGVASRVRYVHDLHLPTLLSHARGTIVLNSTVGCSSLFHKTPVKVLSRAIYDLDGLTFQGSLEEFWTDPGTVDYEIFLRFRQGLITMCQINGSFYQGPDVAHQVLRGAMALPLPSATPQSSVGTETGGVVSALAANQAPQSPYHG